MRLTFFTRLSTQITSPVELTELGAVVKRIVASVRNSWSHPFAQSTALLTLGFHVVVPAVAEGHVGTVSVRVLAVRGVGGGGGGRGRRYRLAGRSC